MLAADDRTLSGPELHAVLDELGIAQLLSIRFAEGANR
jgi:hypothetical protein